MWVYLMVLLLPACSGRGFNFLGTVVTFYPNETSDDTVVLRYKLAFNECDNIRVQECPFANCSLTVVSVERVDEDSGGEWCLREVVVLVNTSSSKLFELRLTGGQWINVTNRVTDVLAVTHVDVRNRSSVSRPNSSPVTTMLPILRVPSNCSMNWTLLTFDPEGDAVRCRFEDITSVLGLSSSCRLTFSPSNNTVEGAYAVQLLMEDFPRQNITVINDREVEVLRNRISQIPIQFVLMVVPPVAFCDAFQPVVLNTTAANGHFFYATVNSSVRLPIFAQSLGFSELLFCGPSSMNKMITEEGFELSWRPSDSDVGRSHPVCFVIQNTGESENNLQSELRCVYVVVERVLAVLKAGLVSQGSLSMEFLREVFLPQLTTKLVEQGLPRSFTLRLGNITLET
ncbi:uncharacterized protein LOC133560506 isoform X1 [Nerophis ophidion]|uniref:uncharacterized protein LOC133560506 isoform X1 n=1 Tax=Nerophis ophidion TaxID=159077 RepID=UPI002AE04F65|nr:uncharacterized protein LOC133560506 isoform X1 [Nerophis ophidion]